MCKQNKHFTPHPYSGKSIIQYDKNNNIIKIWESMITVEKNLGISQKNISGCCRGIIKTTGGFMWSYNINNL